MKKIINTLLAILVLALLIGIITPAYFSSRNETYLTHFFNNLAQLTHNKIVAKVTQTKSRWFSADSKVLVQLENVEGNPITFDLNVHTNFGPFIFYQEQNK